MANESRWASDDKSKGGASIKVIGAGASGIDVISRISGAGTEGMQFIAADGSASMLDASSIATKIWFGETDEESANADEAMRAALADSDLVFIVADEEDTDLSRVVRCASAAHDGGAVVTAFMLCAPEIQQEAAEDEQQQDDALSQDEVEAFKSTVNAVFFIPHDETGASRDGVCRAICGLVDILLRPALVTATLNDVQRALRGAGDSVVGIGEERGPGCVVEAARSALTSTLMDRSVEGATRIIVAMITGPDTTRAELDEACDVIWRAVDDDVRRLTWGHAVDPTMEGAARVLVIASRYDDLKGRRAELRGMVIGWLDRQGLHYDASVPDTLRLGFELSSRLSQVDIKLMFGLDGYTTLGKVPLKVLADYRDEVMRFITMVNWELRVGNFDLDLFDGEIVFRMNTCYDGLVVLPDYMIENSIMMVPFTLDDYGNALIDVMMGYRSAADAFALMHGDEQ